MKYVLDKKGRATTVGVPEYIDENIFDGCKAEVIVLPEGVKTIGSEAFVGLRGIRSLTVPDGTTYIGSYAFMFCRNLAEVFISDTVEELAGFVFSGCGSLSNVYLGKNLKRMGVGVFENCDSLKSVAFGGTVAQWLDRFGGFSFEVRCLDGVVPAKNNG